MKTIVVDTNAFLRLLLNDIPEQRKATELLFQRAKRKKIRLYVTQIFLFEIDYILKKYYALEKDIVVEWLNGLLSTEYLDIESRATFRKAIVLYKRKNLSFTDCFLHSKAEELEAELFTFDKKLKKV
jgi:predicted nucleic-acid-binding protein